MARRTSNPYALLDEGDSLDQRPIDVEGLREQFFEDPGGHILSISITGSGKTNRLAYLADGFVNWTDETILWIDCGKSDEFLTLAQMGRPLHFLIPAGCDIEIDLKDVVTYKDHGRKITVDLGEVEITRAEINTPRDIWHQMKRSSINILVIQPFFLEYEQYSKYMARVFTELIYDAHHKVFRRLGLLPLTIFCDEFQDICPSKAISLDDVHLRAAKTIAFNLKKLRSIGIRIAAAAQAW
ncbi:MAG TPA: hypothetical protein PK380_07735, partial [Deltaproteobacteria bacterium]|nr:hypothetical protein [Deltaproteobacteria bacterium]